ncbi:cation-translocating P-type ATPase [Alteromonas sp. CYL-A6]|uniref:cation-translocating P-type ATPase n=1 Tax=Alteromonas nitratireducens TaxID=3390813 RepID=UPI0034ACB54A
MATNEHTDAPRLQGLTESEAAALLAEYGPNALPAAPLPGMLHLFFRQFLSPFIYILIIAAVVSFALNKLPSAVFIVIVLLLNALIGMIQEYSAQRAASALKNMVKGTAHVIRQGQVATIDSLMLVPGDIILLASGDKVPADAELVSAQNLAADESMLTGESLAVAKSASATSSADDPLTAQPNRCFAGSIITQGRAMARVTHTGIRTQLGQIAHSIVAERVSEPPLMIRVRTFTYQLAAGILLAIAALTALMLFRGGYSGTDIVLMTIGLAVSVIPEGLPAALTIALAIGMSRMAKNNVIIRKLMAVEALGSSTFICSDKTGTLTVNELTIRKVVLPDGTTFSVSGEGVAPGGDVQQDAADRAEKSRLQQLCKAGVLANESHLDYAGGEWVSNGDIVDIAFLVLAKKLGMSISQLRSEQAQIALIPYESENAYSGSIHEANGETYLYAKGSPEKMLSMCSQMQCKDSIRPIDHALLEAQFTALAQQGYRIIALGCKTSDNNHHFSELTFLGMVAMIDPLRQEAKDAIAACRDGGIEVAMVTGDHPATACAIAGELGLTCSQDSVITGPLIKQANSQQEADTLIRASRVFARIEPKQKVQIVDSFMRAGHFVAVTGDGVNDAPAMRQANVGIAMGKRGTDVARETADLIITDDNFASIVAGIKQGRVVYNNIRKVIALLVATGFSAILLFFLCVTAGLPMPLLAVQLLWLNLVANGFQDVALAFEPAEGDELSARPRSPHEPIFDRRLLEHVLVNGLVMGTIAFGLFQWLISSGQGVEHARNLTLMLMVLFGNIYALNSRSETRSIVSMPLRRNLFLVLAVPIAQCVHIGAMYTPWLSNVLQLTPITLSEWLMLLGMALSLLLIEEGHKALIRRRLISNSDPTD